RFVVYFGGANNIWIGLYISYPSWTRTLTWVDGSSLSYSPNYHLSTGTRDYKDCVHINSSLPCLNNWSLGNCNQRYHWICEKKTH
ncbi:hypothetical protein CHARACLAT_031548, partial [Characodon lateralis]|nr:hypothetical protein [Characodon lateralis]